MNRILLKTRKNLRIFLTHSLQHYFPHSRDWESEWSPLHTEMYCDPKRWILVFVAQSRHSQQYGRIVFLHSFQFESIRSGGFTDRLNQWCARLWCLIQFIEIMGLCSCLFVFSAHLPKTEQHIYYFRLRYNHIQQPHEMRATTLQYHHETETYCFIGSLFRCQIDVKIYLLWFLFD